MFLFYFVYLSMSVLPACISMYHGPEVFWKPEEGVRSLVTGVTDGCELPCGCWELNLEGSRSPVIQFLDPQWIRYDPGQVTYEECSQHLCFYYEKFHRWHTLQM